MDFKVNKYIVTLFISEITTLEPENKLKIPNIFSRDIDKLLFASIYYGWAVAKYGEDCKNKDWW